MRKKYSELTKRCLINIHVKLFRPVFGFGIIIVLCLRVSKVESGGLFFLKWI